MQTESVLALDVGERRIGVAIASVVARLSSPLMTLEVDEQIIERIRELIKKHSVGMMVVGLPRNLQGENTKQTEFVEDFVMRLKEHIDVKIVFQDEALTSVNAAAELQARGAKYDKKDVDSLAAVYILDDYLQSIIGGKN
jgi:putative holliday junction resolvase